MKSMSAERSQNKSGEQLVPAGFGGKGERHSCNIATVLA
jgi:hypothetical protein